MFWVGVKGPRLAATSLGNEVCSIVFKGFMCTEWHTYTIHLFQGSSLPSLEPRLFVLDFVSYAALERIHNGKFEATSLSSFCV